MQWLLLLQEEETKKVALAPWIKEVYPKVQTKHSLKDLVFTATKERELSKSEERTVGTPTSNQSPSIMKRYMVPWKSLLKESDA